MANGAKKDETRNSTTKFRGEVAICAAKKWTPQMQTMACSEPFFHALCGREAKGFSDFSYLTEQVIRFTPLGCVVAVGELYDSWTSERWMDYYFPEGFGDIDHMARERQFGNYAPDRGVWRFRNMRKLKKPVPVIGRQFWFSLSPEKEAEVRAQL